MKALIYDGKVCQVETESFPVVTPLYWVACDSNVIPGYIFQGGIFIAPVQPEQTITQKLMIIDAELSVLNQFIPRALEDYWESINFDVSTLPHQAPRLARIKELRTQRAVLVEKI